MSDSFESDRDINLRDKLIDVGEVQMKQNDQAINMNIMMEDTKQKGQQGLEKLYQQGRQLQKINTTNKEIFHEVKKVDKTTEQMRRRQYYMNCLLYFVALALFISIVTLLGIKLSKKIN